MVDKKQVIKERLEHIGLFDFSDVYGYAHSLLKDDKYGVTEERYAEKLEGNKKDIIAEWKAEKELSDYFKLELKVKIEAKNLTDVEVEIDGEKKEMNKGELSFDIAGTLLKDPEGKWEGSALWRFMRDFYNKFIIPRRVKRTEDMVRNSVIGFKDDLKAYLELTGKR